MRRPPDIEQADWEKALESFASIVGPEWVFTDEEEVDFYKDAYSPYWGEEVDSYASAAVAPYTAEEVSELMKVASKYRIPMYPISTGKNLGHGGSAPGYPGAVVLDLKRMNRILNVDDRNHSVLVEPGVTFFDIYEYFVENDLDICLDIPDPAWGSLIGNALEHGLGHTGFYGRDRFSTCNGMEIVTGDGMIVRTGPGSVPGSKIWQDHKYGFGPQLDGIFSQSNFGVVTKMGFWGRPQLQGYQAYKVKLPKRDDLYAMVDADCYLCNSDIINGMMDYMVDLPGTSPFNGRGMDALKDPQYRKMIGGGYQKPNYGGLEKYAADNGYAYWDVHIRMNGPEEVVRAKWKFAKEYIQDKIPHAKCEEFGPFLNFPLSEGDKSKLNAKPYPNRVYLGMPSLDRFKMFADAHLFYSPLVQKEAGEIFKAQEVFAKAYEDLKIFGPNFYYAMPLFHFPKTPHWVLPLRVGRDRKVNQNTRRAYFELVRLAGEHNWGDYRAAPPFHDALMALSSYNDGALLKFSERIKDAIDPAGVISPGRGGIWPKHLRHKRGMWDNV